MEKHNSSEHALSNQGLDGCEFYLLQESQPAGIMLCRHERTNSYPVSFTLIFCPNDFGNSEITAYKIFGAELYYTETYTKHNNGNEKDFIPVIEGSTDITSFLGENPELILNKCWESIFSAKLQMNPLFSKPYPEIIAEANRILKNCRENHLPARPKTKKTK